jgi:hypothetical protein
MPGQGDELVFDQKKYQRYLRGWLSYAFARWVSAWYFMQSDVRSVLTDNHRNHAVRCSSLYL